MALTTPPPRHRLLDTNLDKLGPNRQFYTTGLGEKREEWEIKVDYNHPTGRPQARLAWSESEP